MNLVCSLTGFSKASIEHKGCGILTCFRKTPENVLDAHIHGLQKYNEIVPCLDIHVNFWLRVGECHYYKCTPALAKGRQFQTIYTHRF